MKISGNKYKKFLPKDNLLKVINQIPEGSFVTVNAVGNLAIVNRDKNNELQFIGFIDFLGEGEFNAE